VTSRLAWPAHFDTGTGGITVPKIRESSASFSEARARYGHVRRGSRDYPVGGMWSRPDERPFRTVLRGGEERTGPLDERDAERCS
jgi:hypothetical protein